MISINVTLGELPELLPREALGEVRGIIIFPAAHAQYHDQTATPSQPRDIYAASFRRRRAEIGSHFERLFTRSLNLERSIEAVTREHLSEMRAYELDAPGAGPPALNPFRDRVRRITGQLADTSFVRVEKLR